MVGWASLLISARDASLGKDVVEIAVCYVRPALWGRGLGRLLMTTALEAARGLEKTLWSSGFSRKTRAQRLSSTGFTLTVRERPRATSLV